MRKLNLYFGIILFIIFIATGLYMRFSFRPEHMNDLVARMEIRSNHIYILFISLLNIISFVVIGSDRSILVLNLNRFSRSLFIISGILSVFAFVYEHNGTLQGRALTFYCILFSLIGTVFFLITYALSFQMNSKEKWK